MTKQIAQYFKSGWWLLFFSLALTCLVYWPGLSGGWLFDDYPNIVDNPAVQPAHPSLPLLINAALSSPSSEFKRPLASFSFAINYLISGLDPYWMKLTNLAIHLLNGLLVFLLARSLLRADRDRRNGDISSSPHLATPRSTELGTSKQIGFTAALIAAGWMLAPINLTGVLYVVQRMESMANLFVLIGLVSYVTGRRYMLNLAPSATPARAPLHQLKGGDGIGLMLGILSITVPTIVGALAKETAVMLPLYAAMIEWALFRFKTRKNSPDLRVIALFVAVLILPMILGLAWLIPKVVSQSNWATRDFTLGTRLLSEARIVVGYIIWTLLPMPQMLSFYHDNFHISSGLLSPWTTAASILALAALVTFVAWLRPHRPLAALGIALFLSCQLLTATILPLELIYEHRNYFASFGLMLALIPLLTGAYSEASPASFALPRRVLLVGLLVLWIGETAMTAAAWSSPLALAATLAARAPDSPRAQYELGRTYIIYSNYDPSSPYTKLAYVPLERSAALPDSSILPEQALIFMNSRMHLALKDVWWCSMIAKLKAHKPSVQDESSIGALTQCMRDNLCDLPKDRMTSVYLNALSHERPSARLLAMYGDYAWNVLIDHSLGERMTADAVTSSPDEPAYRITLIRMLVVLGRLQEANEELLKLQHLNYGGRLDRTLGELRALLPPKTAA
jgi:protein O-mannosyl-transferase